MSFPLASYMEVIFIIVWIVSGRGAVLYGQHSSPNRSNLITPLERIPSEGDARLKMAASWGLVELEDGPQVWEIK